MKRNGSTPSGPLDRRTAFATIPALASVAVLPSMALAQSEPYYGPMWGGG